MIEKLNWDSDFFGYPVGAVTIKSLSNFDEELFFRQANNFKLIYVFSSDEISNNRLTLVDEKVILTKEIENSDTNPGFKYCELYSDKDANYSQLLELALLSGKYSRFKLDPNFINNEFENLYTKWLNNGLSKESFSQTLIVKDLQTIKGFISLKKRDETSSEIGLVAVNPKFQGQGIASQLLSDIEILASIYGSRSIQVATQKSNIPAVNLYLKNGYKLSQSTKIYHLWNN